MRYCIKSLTTLIKNRLSGSRKTDVFIVCFFLITQHNSRLVLSPLPLLTSVSLNIFFFMLFSTSLGGNNLQTMHRERRADSGWHSHLPAEDMEHNEWGASIPAVLQWSFRICPQNGGRIHVSTKIVSSCDLCGHLTHHILSIQCERLHRNSKYLHKSKSLPRQKTVPPQQCCPRYGRHASRSDSLAGRRDRGRSWDDLQGLRYSHGHPWLNTSNHQGPGGKHLEISKSVYKTACSCFMLLFGSVELLLFGEIVGRQQLSCFSKSLNDLNVIWLWPVSLDNNDRADIKNWDNVNGVSCSDELQSEAPLSDTVFYQNFQFIV